MCGAGQRLTFNDLMPELGPILATCSWFVLSAVAGAGDFLSIFIWFVIAAILVLCGYYVAVAVRRWVQRDETVATFTIQDLRDMRARGQISDQEFAAMRTALLTQLELTEIDDARSRGGASEAPKGEQTRPEDETPPETDGSPPPDS